MYQSSFDLTLDKLKKTKSLNVLELFRISNDIIIDYKSKFICLVNLAQLVINNANLSVLKLNLFEMEEIKIIADIVKNNISLKKIKIFYKEGFKSKNKIDVIRNNQFLSINLINFDRTCFDFFLKCYLTKQKTLNELILTNNKLETSTINVLINFLNENCSLIYLELVKCSIMDKHFIAISEAIKNNKTLKRINFENNHLTNNIRSTILELNNEGIYINLNNNLL